MHTKISRQVRQTGSALLHVRKQRAPQQSADPAASCLLTRAASSSKLQPAQHILHPGCYLRRSHASRNEQTSVCAILHKAQEEAVIQTSSTQEKKRLIPPFCQSAIPALPGCTGAGAENTRRQPHFTTAECESSVPDASVLRREERARGG